MGAKGDPPIERLDGVVRDYVWGSHTAIARLQGRPAPTPGPEAELWLGAHPSAPSVLRSGGTTRPLDVAIATDPPRVLGRAVAERFDGQLPFLLKVLAIDQPLSLQAHPSAEQARAGFRAEDARGVALASPERTYRDSWPKPELLCALTAVDALCGFRDPSATLELLDGLGVEELGWLSGDLAERGDGALGDAVGRLLRWPAERRASLVEDVVVGAGRVAGSGGEHAAMADWLVALGLRYPDDPGVAVALLLHHVRLAPGEAIHLPAGNLHAYLGGTAVEVMAASDNVLRGGLTVKHVDVDGLLEVLEASALPIPRVPIVEIDGGRAYPVGSEHFALERFTPGDREVTLDRHGPEILLNVGAGTEVVADRTSLVLESGEAAFVPASTGAVTLRGDGPVFRARAGCSAPGA